MINRRIFLRTTVLVPVGALVACAGYQSASQLVTDVSLIASGLQGALPGLGTAGVSASAVAQVGKYVSQLQTLAAGVSSALSPNASTVQQVIAVVGQIASIAGPLLPPPWGTAIAAAEVLLPVIATAAGLVTAPPTAAAVAPAMTPEQARLVLASMPK